MKDISVTVNSRGVPIVPLTVKSDLPSVCRGMQVIKVVNLTNTTDSSASLTNSIASPTVVTSTSHGLTNGDEIIITGSDSVPSINGKWNVSVLTANTFSLPIAVTGAGTVGTWWSSSTPSSVPLITFSDNSGQISVNKVTGLKASNKYSLRVILYP